MFFKEKTVYLFLFCCAAIFVNCSEVVISLGEKAIIQPTTKQPTTKRKPDKITGQNPELSEDGRIVPKQVRREKAITPLSIFDLDPSCIVTVPDVIPIIVRKVNDCLAAYAFDPENKNEVLRAFSELDEEKKLHPCNEHINKLLVKIKDHDLWKNYLERLPKAFTFGSDHINCSHFNTAIRLLQKLQKKVITVQDKDVLREDYMNIRSFVEQHLSSEILPTLPKNYQPEIEKFLNAMECLREQYFAEEGE